MQLSVIILNYNVRYHLQLCLLSVQRAIKHLNAEIIVVDNASTDTSLEMLKTSFPDIKLIANQENLGFAKANNLGVSRAEGTYVCILNPDTVVPEHCFEQLLNYAETLENPGALGIGLIDGTGNFLPESKRNIPTPRVALAKLLKKSAQYYANHLYEDQNGPVEVLVGAFMLLKREVYLEMAGFDEDYFMYGEDIDLSYRLLQAGYQNHYYGALKAIHFKGESTLRNKVYAKRFYDAMGIFYKKHFGSNMLEQQMVDLTLRAAKRLKGLSRPKRAMSDCNEESFLLYSSDLCFEQKLKHKFPLLTNCIEQLPAGEKIGNGMVILDAGSFSFSDIISCMQTCKHIPNRVRIHPPECNFLLGSDSSTRQGNVILLED